MENRNYSNLMESTQNRKMESLNKHIKRTELKYLLGLTLDESKEAFKEILRSDKVNASDTITVEQANTYYGNIKNSVDPRLDNVGVVYYAIANLRLRYKKELSKKSIIDHQGFYGFYKIYYKLLGVKELVHAHESIKRSHAHKYPKMETLEVSGIINSIVNQYDSLRTSLTVVELLNLTQEKK